MSLTGLPVAWLAGGGRPVLRRERFALRLQAAFKHAAAAAAVQPQKRDAGRGRRPGKKVAAGQPDWDVEIFI